MKELEKIGMLKGTLNAEQQISLISGCTDLKAAVEGAIYIQVSTCCFISNSPGFCLWCGPLQ